MLIDDMGFGVCDVGRNEGTNVSQDYEQGDNEFSGKIEYVKISVN